MLLKSPSLLITDDDSDFRETLHLALEPRGFRTLLAGDGEEALQIVRREEVHLLLLDMHMPKLTGLETLRLVRQFRAMLPCILLVGAVGRRALGAGPPRAGLLDALQAGDVGADYRRGPPGAGADLRLA